MLSVQRQFNVGDLVRWEALVKTAKPSTGYGSGGTGAYSITNGVGEPGRNGVVIIWEYK